MSKLALIIAELLKDAPMILPLFIHNPKSQTISAVVVGETGALLSAVAEAQTAHAANQATIPASH